MHPRSLATGVPSQLSEFLLLLSIRFLSRLPSLALDVTLLLTLPTFLPTGLGDLKPAMALKGLSTHVCKQMVLGALSVQGLGAQQASIIPNDQGREWAVSSALSGLGCWGPCFSVTLFNPR